MTDTPESVVRQFFAAWAEPRTDELGRFFADDAVWVDGPQGVRAGVDAIIAELAAQLAVTGGTAVDVKSLVADGGTVMVEEVSSFSLAGKPVSAVVMAVFEFNADGRIQQWREAYDLKSLTDQIEAAVQRPM
jgi:limonene-1,2-epoxide hydrolase